MLGDIIQTGLNVAASAGVSLWTAALALIVPAAIFALIAYAVRRRASFETAWAAAGEVRVNLTLYAIDILFVTPLLALAGVAMGALIQRGGLVMLDQAMWAVQPAWLTLFAAVFAGDFVSYWRHRLEHTPWLWPAHAIHHSDTAMTWTTLLRFHPINRFTTGLIDSGMLAILGFPLWAIIANNLIRHFYGMFIHMDLPWTYGAAGRIFVSPAMHRWHHVREASGAGANFATMFSIFDQAFGTFHLPGPCREPLGVRERIAPGALGQLWLPVRVLIDASMHASRALTRRRATPAS